MEKRRLGQSDLMVSRICLGCMGFGDATDGPHSWTLNEEDSRAIIKQALEAGITFFDTALGYQNGSSERFVGRALRDFAKREEVVLATKFLPRSKEDIESGVSGRAHIERSLEQSLENLGMDYIDLYIYHIWDYNTPIEEVMDTLNDAIVAGKVREIGIANCFAWQLAKANAYADKMGYKRFVSVQSHYNLIMREDERELMTYCQEEGIATTPYSALAGGRLSRLPGVTTKRLEEDKFAKSKYDQTAEEDNKIIARVAELADKYQTSMTSVSLAWLLTRVDAPVVGATKPHHLDGPLAALDLQLSPEDLAYLEELYLPHALSGVMAQNTYKPRA